MIDTRRIAFCSFRAAQCPDHRRFSASVDALLGPGWTELKELSVATKQVGATHNQFERYLFLLSLNRSRPLSCEWVDPYFNQEIQAETDAEIAVTAWNYLMKIYEEIRSLQQDTKDWDNFRGLVQTAMGVVDILRGTDLRGIPMLSRPRMIDFLDNYNLMALAIYRLVTLGDKKHWIKANMSISQQAERALLTVRDLDNRLQPCFAPLVSFIKCYYEAASFYIVGFLMRQEGRDDYKNYFGKCLDLLNRSEQIELQAYVPLCLVQFRGAIRTDCTITQCPMRGTPQLDGPLELVPLKPKNILEEQRPAGAEQVQPQETRRQEEYNPSQTPLTPDELFKIQVFPRYKDLNEAVGHLNWHVSRLSGQNQAMMTNLRQNIDSGMGQYNLVRDTVEKFVTGQLDWSQDKVESQINSSYQFFSNLISLAMRA